MDSTQLARLEKIAAILAGTGGGVKAGDANAAIAAELAALGTEGRVGVVRFAGRHANGEYRVQFDVPGDGWSSPWPEWAYDLARDALLNRRQLWVISDGVPWGNKLLVVLVTDDEA